MINVLDMAMEEFRRKASAHNDGVIRELNGIVTALNDAKVVFEEAMKRSVMAHNQVSDMRLEALNKFQEQLLITNRSASQANAMRAKACDDYGQHLSSIETALLTLISMLNSGMTIDGSVTEEKEAKQLSPPSSSPQSQVSTTEALKAEQATRD